MRYLAQFNLQINFLNVDLKPPNRIYFFTMNERRNRHVLYCHTRTIHIESTQFRENKFDPQIASTLNHQEEPLRKETHATKIPVIDYANLRPYSNS